jgi:hypothetical protein
MLICKSDQSDTSGKTQENDTPFVRNMTEAATEAANAGI